MTYWTILLFFKQKLSQNARVVCETHGKLVVWKACLPKFKHSLGLQSSIWTTHKTSGTMSMGQTRLKWRCLVVMHKTKHSVSAQTLHTNHEQLVLWFCNGTRTVAESTVNLNMKSVPVNSRVRCNSVSKTWTCWSYCRTYMAYCNMSFVVIHLSRSCPCKVQITYIIFWYINLWINAASTFLFLWLLLSAITRVIRLSTEVHLIQASHKIRFTSS